MLKELVDDDLAQPSFVAFNENRQGEFSLVIKGECDLAALTDFVAEKGLVLEEDNEKGYYIIHKP